MTRIRRMVQPSYRPELTALRQGYGILGEAGHALRCRQVMPLARAFGDLLAPNGDGTFAIGHDVRASSPSIAEAISLGLRSGGHHAIHIGACTRPQLEWYVAEAGLSGALMITGGCAPPEWNGIRLHGAHAEPIHAANVLDALEIYDLNALFSTPCNPMLSRDQPQPAYAAWLRQRLRPQRHLKLCVDIGNGLAGAEFEAIVAHYRQLRLWRIGFTPDPAFPTRGPDPFSPHACASLSEYVIANGCDLGAALDADGVHLAVTDEHGQRLAPQTLGILLALALASARPGLRVYHHGGLSAPAARALRRAGVETRPLRSGPRAAWSALHASGRPGFYFDREGHYAFSDFPGTANAMLALIELINHLTGSDSALSVLARAIDPAPAI
jgi:phosphomannomutase